MFSFTHAGAIASPCSPDNRTSDLSQCLSTMINNAKDNTRFWYGTSYPARCPNPWGSVDCFNPNPYRADSLVSRVFGPGYVLQDSLITTFLSVTFETGTGKLRFKFMTEYVCYLRSIALLSKKNNSYSVILLNTTVNCQILPTGAWYM